MYRKVILLPVLAFLVVVFSSSLVLAQDTKPRREVGLQFNSLDFDGGSSFSAFFKKQKKENVYRRVRILFGNLTVGTIDEDFTFNFSAGINIGREKRKTLDPKLEFYQGPEFSLRLALSSLVEDDLRTVVAPGFGWAFGLQHSFNDRWAVNIETVPSVSITATIDDGVGPDLLTFGAGVSSAVSVGLLRKF